MNNPPSFRLTEYEETVTEESAREGDVASTDIIRENEAVTLREAMEEVEDYPADQVNVSHGRLIFYPADSTQDYRTGDWTSRTIVIEGSDRNLNRLLAALGQTQGVPMARRRNPALEHVENLGPNQMGIRHGDVTVFYSYETPVAAALGHGVLVRTDTFHSRTTSKHINKWLDGRPASKVPQEVIDRLAREGDSTVARGHLHRNPSRHRGGHRSKSTAPNIWDRVQGPGKFEGEPRLTELLYGSVDGGDASLNVGDTYYELWVNLSTSYPWDVGQYKGDPPAAAIIHERSDGFVDGEWYDSNEAAWADWEKIEEAFADSMDDEVEE